uniref:Beclin-1-like protein n=1 Tax=Syphacia muris TaxID=451379 RepID=A0A0N5AYW3_9BILA
MSGSQQQPCCINCQTELVLDESLYQNDAAKLATLPLNEQIGSLNLEGQAGNLYDIICNSNSPLTGPICETCTDNLLDGMDQQLKGLEEEYTNYRKLYESLKSKGITEFDIDDAKSKIAELKTEQEARAKEIKDLEEKERILDEKLSAQKNELKAVKEAEEKLWRKFRDNHRKLLDMDNEEQDIDVQLNYTKEQIKKLSGLNVLNTTFHIWNQGNFGTINGFRLGRLPCSPVEWNEINAAWGQAALLLTVLLKSVEGCELDDYKIFPMGNHSFIRVLATGEDLPLYGSGGFKPFGQKNFDEAIIAYVKCFRHLQKHIEEHSGFQLPHRIQRDLIEDNRMEYSVKMQFNSEERWTKAMKCLLINLRWAMTLVVTLKNC